MDLSRSSRRIATIAVVCLGLATAALQAVVAPTASAATPVTPGGYEGTWTPTYNQDFPDPSVMPYDGVLYAYSTETVAANIPGAETTDPGTWTTVSSDIFPTLPAFAGGGRTWAPSVEQAADGQFVMYYTALNPAGDDQCIGQATSASPTGPFKDGNAGFVMCQTTLGGSIDPQIFEGPGGPTLLWKSDGNSDGQATHLWSESLDPDLDLTGATPALLLSNDESWQAGIIEGPNMVDEDGTFDLFYGAGHYTSAGYSIGYATCAGPAGPCSDHDRAVLVSGTGERGPGGPGFFDYDGSLLMAFSAWPGPIGYDAGGYRALYVATVTFGPGGTPNFAPYNTGSDGYAMAGSDGSAYSFGNAVNAGSSTGLDAPVVGLATTSDGHGYWEVSSDGGVFSFGDAAFHGSTGGITLNRPIVGMAADPATGGYWLVASDGGVFAFDAPYLGSMGGQRLNQPVVGIAAAANGQGYWLVSRDGGVFSFGTAAFHGSTGGITLNRPVVGITTDQATGGYWLVASDGGVFAFDAPYLGSTGGQALAGPIVGMASDPATGGYWLAGSDGGVFAFDAPYLGSLGTDPPAYPVVGIVAS
jgi:hypothetical protein